MSFSSLKTPNVKRKEDITRDLQAEGAFSSFIDKLNLIILQLSFMTDTTTEANDGNLED